MSDIGEARKKLETRILEGKGTAPAADRRAAFDNSGLPAPWGALADQVARRAYAVSDEDVAAVKAAGLTEDQIFEVLICAAVGQASRIYEAGLAALDAADGES